MPTYSYIALDPSGKKIKGEVEAEDERDVVSQLRPRRFTIISVKRKSKVSELGGKELSQLSIFSPRIKGRDIIIAFRQMATLINAGLPIVQCLDILIHQTPNPTLKKVFIQIKADVEAGVSLSEALAKTKKFPPLTYNLIKAGETGGVLDDLLLRLASYLEEAESIKERVKSALRYPLFVLFMAGGLTLALLFYVLPRMEELFREAFKADLPAFTAFILNFSRLLREKFYIIPVILGIVLLVYFIMKKTEKGAYLIDSLKLKIPVLGKLFHRIALSRFTRTLATLTDSGVPILDALELTGKASGNKVIEKATEEARQALREGETIAAPLRKYPIFPPLTISMISVGERTGALDDMLNKIADLYEDEVKRMVDSLTSLLEPLLIAFMGASVGIVVVAMYLPYFTMFQHIGG